MGHIFLSHSTNDGATVRSLQRALGDFGEGAWIVFIVHLASRRVVHVAAMRRPTQTWTAQQLRNATTDGDALAVLLWSGAGRRESDPDAGPGA